MPLGSLHLSRVSRQCILNTASSRNLASWALNCLLKSCHLAWDGSVSMRGSVIQQQSLSCAAFVGADAAPAGEYHDNDFSWEVHRDSIRASHPEFLHDFESASSSNGAVRDLFASQSGKNNSWEKFHARDNATAKFYKQRRYLLLEFPELQITEPPQHFVEIGCGCGSSILPVLKANPSCRATATDLSPTAIQMLDSVAAKLDIEKHRISSFAFDSTSPDAASHPLHGLEANGLLLIFTLAALHPNQMAAMLDNAYKALAPGGVLMIRDHGIGDITHLRLAQEQRIGHRLFSRKDDTLCYFFSTQDLQARMERAGFVTVECKYACVNLRNRKHALQMKRVFVHGKFQKPYRTE